MGSIVTKFRPYLEVLPRAKRNRTDLLRWMLRRPQVLAGIGAYEAGLLAAGRGQHRHRALAQLRVSSLIGCPF